jgi:fused signal recognition particle receptor
MRELEKVRRVMQKRLPEAPHATLLVLDATAGQNAVQQAKVFKDSMGVTGLVLTKLDGTAKGGAIIQVRRELALPVRFIGVGEGMDDLQPFDPDAFVEAIFGDA